MSYLCVDGGQTKTAVSLLDEEGKTLESWREGPLTTPSKPGAADNLRAVVRSACEELGRRLERSGGAAPEAACLSLTGYHEGDEFVPPLVKEEARKVVPNLERIHVIPTTWETGPRRRRGSRRSWFSAAAAPSPTDATPPGTLRGREDGDTSSATRGAGIGSGSKPSRWSSAPTTAWCKDVARGGIAA